MNRIIKIGIRSALVSMFFWASARDCFAAAPQSDTIPVYFRSGSSLIERSFLGNNANLLLLDERIEDSSAARIERITVVASSSPEGTMESNSAIMERRAQALRRQFTRKYPHLAAVSTIRIETIDQTLTRFLRAVEADELMPNRAVVLDILYDQSRSSVMRLNAVKQMPGVKTYIAQNIYPYMRAASVYIGREVPPPPPPVNDTIRIIERIVTVDTLRIEVAPAVDTTAVVAVDTTAVVAPPVEVAEPVVVEPAPKPRPLFALKSNLLFDALTILNLGAEVPIGPRWSVAGELMFPWWVSHSKQNALQVMSGTVEGKYWFGNRERRPDGRPRELLTGWFAGLYAGGGYYDLERNHTGYQGEFFIAAGVSGGYAHTINKKGNLRMEYSLGVGYMQTNYRKYEAQFGSDNRWHLYRRADGKYQWFGPTSLKVSLVWMLNRKQKGGSK